MYDISVIQYRKNFFISEQFNNINIYTCFTLCIIHIILVMISYTNTYVHINIFALDILTHFFAIFIKHSNITIKFHNCIACECY